MSERHPMGDNLRSEVAAWRKRLAQIPGEIAARKQELAQHPERYERVPNDDYGTDRVVYRLELEQVSGESYVGMYGHFADSPTF